MVLLPILVIVSLNSVYGRVLNGSEWLAFPYYRIFTSAFFLHQMTAGRANVSAGSIFQFYHKQLLH